MNREALFFSCRGHSPSTGPAKTERGCSHETLTIDLHCHAHIAAADAVVAPDFDMALEPMLKFATQQTRDVNRAQMAGLQPKLTAVEARLRDMDLTGVDVQAISPSPFQYHYWAEADRAREAARLVNDGIAALVAAAPERFVGFGTIPMQHPDLALAELDRVVSQLGFRGVQLAMSVGRDELSAGRYRKVLARAEELGILVFLHPNGFSDGERLADHYLINTIGNPLDTTVAVARLILDGVLDALPRLNICLAHGGGYLPVYADRLDHAWRAREDARGSCSLPPSEYLRRLYYDTVVFSERHLRYLVDCYGEDRIVMGSDYPYDMAESDPVGFVCQSGKLSDAAKRKILGLNAARLLGIEVAAEEG